MHVVWMDAWIHKYINIYDYMNKWMNAWSGGKYWSIDECMIYYLFL